MLGVHLCFFTSALRTYSLQWLPVRLIHSKEKGLLSVHSDNTSPPLKKSQTSVSFYKSFCRPLEESQAASLSGFLRGTCWHGAMHFLDPLWARRNKTSLKSKWCCPYPTFLSMFLLNSTSARFLRMHPGNIKWCFHCCSLQFSLLKPASPFPFAFPLQPSLLRSTHKLPGLFIFSVVECLGDE